MILHTITFALAHYAALLGLAALGYAVGRKITIHCEFHSTWEHVAVCTSLGLGTIAYLVFALCLAHWLYPNLLLGIIGVAAIVYVPEVRALAREVTASWHIRGDPRRPLGIRAGSLVLVLVLCLPSALLGLYPPGETSYDALLYHLVVAKLYVQHHGFAFAPYVHWSLFPQLNEMLFTLMLMFVDDVAARLVSVLMMAVLVTAVCAWGRQLFSGTVGYWGATILLGIPIVISLGSVAYTDMSLTLFATMAVFSCWNWLHGRGQQWLILAAVFAGFACGTKYTGLFFFALIATVMFFRRLRHRQYGAALLFVAIAAAIAAPLYARNVYYTGNPVFPFLSTIFGPGYWSAQDVAEAVLDVQQTGMGRSVSAFVSLPWQLAFHPSAFRGYPGSQGTKRFFLLMPLVVPFALADGGIMFLCGVAFSYIIYWFFTAQEIRFLVPIFPVISLSMAAALHSFLERFSLGRRWACHGVIVGIVCVAWVYSSWLVAVGTLHQNGAVPVTQAQRETYLARYWPAYPAVKLLNGLKGPGYTLYALGASTMAYFADGTFIGWDFGRARHARILSGLGDNQGLYRELMSLGVHYLLLVRDTETLHEDEFFHRHFKLIYGRPPVELYEINASSSLSKHAETRGF